MIEGVVPAEIEAEGAAIRATLDRSLAAARETATALRAGGTRRVFVIGNGTSYHSSLAAETAYRRLAGPEDPTVVALTAGEFLTYRPALDRRDAVVGISSSGEFRDVVAVLQEVRGRVATVAVIHVPGSTLAGVADHVILSEGGPSHVPVMTKTFVSTLAATHLLLGELLGGRAAEQTRQALARAAQDVDLAVAAAAPRIRALAEDLSNTEHLFVVGSGNAAVAALEAALKLKEMALIHAEGVESWEMATGAATILRPGMVVLGLAPVGPGRAATLDVVRHAGGWGATCIEVGPEAVSGDGAGTPAGRRLILPATASEDYAPLVAVAPVALLAFALARLRGHDPDRPDWVERYHSQGLRHILGGVDGRGEEG
jgi:glucosamine--fructose-6-phosphate aminotransferase (isomerizing)